MKIGFVLGVLLACAGCAAKNDQPSKPDIVEYNEGAHAMAVVCENIAADFRAGKASKDELCSGYDNKGWPI